MDILIWDIDFATCNLIPWCLGEAADSRYVTLRIILDKRPEKTRDNDTAVR